MNKHVVNTNVLHVIYRPFYLNHVKIVKKTYKNLLALPCKLKQNVFIYKHIFKYKLQVVSNRMMYFYATKNTSLNTTHKKRTWISSVSGNNIYLNNSIYSRLYKWAPHA